MKMRIIIKIINTKNISASQLLGKFNCFQGDTRKRWVTRIVIEPDLELFIKTAQDTSQLAGGRFTKMRMQDEHLV